jgi:hypothetical protein
MLENRGIEIKKLKIHFQHRSWLMEKWVFQLSGVRPCLFLAPRPDRSTTMQLATVYPGMHFLRAGNMEGRIALVTVKESKAPRNPLRWTSICRSAFFAAIRPLNPIGRRTL